MPTVPQDVDLEDRIAFGLTPLRFGYLVLAGLAAFATWNSEVIWCWLRVPIIALIAAVASTLVWGRWRGRQLDGLLGDLLIYIFRWCRAHIARCGGRDSC